MPLPRFPVGTPVRVKPGTTDPDFPGIPLDGWAGIVEEVDGRIYLVSWNQATMDQMSPSYRELCEGEDLEMQCMWLEETDLELNAAASPDEKPSTAESALVPLDDAINPKHRQPARDYAQWLASSRAGEAFEFFSDIRFHLPRRRMSFTRALIRVLAGGAVLGIVLGSLLASMEITRYLAVCGAVLLGLVGLVTGSRVGRVVGRLSRVKRASFWGSSLGFLTGGIVGALLGAIFAAVAGVFVGAMVGALAARLAFRGRQRALAIGFGAVIGATVQAFLVDEEQALWGAIYGAAIGAGAALLTVIGAKIILTRYRRRPT